VPGAPAIDATLVEGTNVVQLSAESNDGALAARAVNAYAESYVETRRAQQDQAFADATAQIQGKVSEFDQRIAAVDAAIAELPEENRELSLPSLQGERDTLVEQRAVFRQRLDELNLDAALGGDEGPEVLRGAQTPNDPVSPRPVRYGLMALAAGLLLGISLAFLLDYFDDSIKSTDDLERVSGGVPMLGHIPATERTELRTGVVSRTAPNSPAAEAYRSLRTSVQFLSLDEPLKAIQITSPSAAEGKTTTVANLGVVLAHAGQRVVLVDCDLRRPRLHECFGLENEIGFTSALLGHVPLGEAIQPAPGEDRLAVITSGPVPPNPSELLSAGRTGELLQQVVDAVDVVIIDTPPVLPVTDASVVARWVDGTLMVVMAGLTTGKRLQRAIEKLEPVEDKLVGVVFNRTRREADYGHSPSYRYRYHRPQRRGDRDARVAATES
jgi:capsular exopolysaccharide synthesis family protein